jgi:hypothetical protein
VRKACSTRRGLQDHCEREEECAKRRQTHHFSRSIAGERLY